MGEPEYQKKAKTIGDFVTLVALLIIRRPYISMGLVAALFSFLGWNGGSGITNHFHDGKLSLRFDTLETNTKQWHKDDSTAWAKCLASINKISGNGSRNGTVLKKTAKKAVIFDTINTGHIAQTQESK